MTSKEIIKKEKDLYKTRVLKHKNAIKYSKEQIKAYKKKAKLALRYYRDNLVYDGRKDANMYAYFWLCRDKVKDLREIIYATKQERKKDKAILLMFKLERLCGILYEANAKKNNKKTKKK